MDNFNKARMPADIISNLAGKEVSVMLKSGSELNGKLVSFDENSNLQLKVGEITRFIQGESILALSFR